MKIRYYCFAALLFLATSGSAQTADEIVNKVLASRGGLDKIKAVQSQRITGTITFGPGAEGPFMLELERPGKMHIEVTIMGQTLIRSYNGKSGWVVNPFSGNKEVQPMTAEDLANISDESDFDGPLVDYTAKGNHIEFAGREDVDGKPAYRLKLTTAKREARAYIFDAATYRLVKWEGSRKMGDKEVPWESFFKDYRDVNGLQFAFEIDSDAPGTEQTQKILADKIEVDPQIDQSHFAKPTPPPAPVTPAETSEPPAPASPAPATDSSTPPPPPQPQSTLSSRFVDASL